jgi:hypothetical protein
MFDEVVVEPGRNSRMKVRMARDIPLAEVWSSATRIDTVNTVTFLDNKLPERTVEDVVGVVLVPVVHGVGGDASDGDVAISIVLFCKIGSIQTG